MEPIVAQLFSSQLVVITAALGGLAVTTLAILRDIGTRRSAPIPEGVAPPKP